MRRYRYRFTHENGTRLHAILCLGCLADEMGEQADLMDTDRHAVALRNIEVETAPPGAKETCCICQGKPN